jgi:2-haloacid dehalogenase
MTTTRREFVKALGGAAAAAGLATPGDLQAQAPRPNGITTLAFDAYGTLFDVFSVTSLCEEFFPGQGTPLAQLWRAKQLQYSTLRSLMGRHATFWQVTEDGLVYASKSLGLDLTAAKRQQLMDAYLTLTAYPDVRPGLLALKQAGLRVAILSNGEPKMLRAAAQSAGIDQILDDIISIEDIGVFKPKPEVYGLIQKHLPGEQSAIGFVSSNSWDIAGAASAGLTTFWIQRRAEEPQEELGYPAAHIIHAVTDLPALVAG